MAILAEDEEVTYPSDHKVGMRVPKGGSSCAVCEYLRGPHLCGNKDFIESVKLGKAEHARMEGKFAHFDLPADEYCCDFYESPLKMKAAAEKDPDGWHGVDFDGTIAHYDHFRGMEHTGDPIEGDALNKVRAWLKKGEKVKIFTARARDPIGVKAIEEWCLKHLGQKLEVTNEKDEHMIDSLDDRNEKVKLNTGEILAASLWHGVKLEGFTVAEEEAIRSILARVPNELLFNIDVIQSAKELNAKHGRYVPDEKKILFNPGNLILRQKFGGGEIAIRHDILTLVHEIGHSLWAALTPEEREAWLKLSGWVEGRGPGQASAYVERRPGWEPYTSKWTHRADVKFPRYYAEKNPNEHFSDAFAYFMLNKAYRLSDDQRQYFEDYIFNHVKKYPQALIQSPIKAAADTIVAEFVSKLADVIHEGGFNGNQRSHDSVYTRRENIRIQQGNEKNNGSSGHSTSKLKRDGIKSSISQWDSSKGEGGIRAEGTTEGAIKGWDKRGRGKKKPESTIEQKTEQPPQPEKKKYKPGEKMKEKAEKFLSGDTPPAKGGKISILGGIWTGNAAPVVIYKTMMTGEWHSRVDLAMKMPKDVLEKWAKAHAEAVAKGDTKFWSVNDRIDSGIKRVTKAGKDFGQWTMETKWEGNQTLYRLVMNKVQDQAKGQEGITKELQHDALTIVQKMINNKGLDQYVSSQLLDEYAKQVGVENFNLLSSSMSSWTGDPDGVKAQMLKRVAADYYGNDWSKEWKDGNPNTSANDTTSFKYDELKKQALAIKALSNEYMKAAGISYLYRGMSLSGKQYEDIKQAVKEGKATPVPLNSLSGFSKSIGTAKSFGGSVVIRVKVDPESVWVASGAMPHLFGNYAKGEKEYLVGSKSNTVAYVDASDVWIKDYKEPIVPEWAKS